MGCPLPLLMRQSSHTGPRGPTGCVSTVGSEHPWKNGCCLRLQFDLEKLMQGRRVPGLLFEHLNSGSHHSGPCWHPCFRPHGCAVAPLRGDAAEDPHSSSNLQGTQGTKPVGVTAGCMAESFCVGRLGRGCRRAEGGWAHRRLPHCPAWARTLEAGLSSAKPDDVHRAGVPRTGILSGSPCWKTFHPPLLMRKSSPSHQL